MGTRLVCFRRPRFVDDEICKRKRFWGKRKYTCVLEALFRGFQLIFRCCVPGRVLNVEQIVFVSNGSF